MPTALENNIIENFTQYDEEIAQRIMDEMFVFDDLLNVDDQGIQLLLREIQSDSLITALKGAKEELRSKVFKICRSVLLRYYAKISKAGASSCL